MILTVSVKLNEIFIKGRRFNWDKPDACPCCGSIRVWGHGFVLAYFDGYDQGLYLRRYRCPDCRCVMRMRPQGYFPRFHTTIHTIRSCLYHRLNTGRWKPDISRSRQRHWLFALKRKAMAFFGVAVDLIGAFDELTKMNRIPVSRTI